MVNAFGIFGRSNITDINDCSIDNVFGIFANGSIYDMAAQWPIYLAYIQKAILLT